MAGRQAPVRVLAPVLALGLLLAGTPADGAGRADDEAAIRAVVIDRLGEAWRLGDGERWVEPYAEGSEFINIFGALLPDREANRARHQALFDGVFAGAVLEQRLRRLVFLGPDHAVADVDVTLTGYRRLPPFLADALGAAEGARPPLRTRFKHVLARGEDGAWRILATQNTAVVPNLAPR